MSNPINNVQPEFCRRRAIWGVKHITSEGVSNEAQYEKRQDANDALRSYEEIETPLIASKYACSKCGKEVRRGMFFHQKYCRG